MYEPCTAVHPSDNIVRGEGKEGKEICEKSAKRSKYLGKDHSHFSSTASEC